MKCLRVDFGIEILKSNGKRYEYESPIFQLGSHRCGSCRNCCRKVSVPVPGDEVEDGAGVAAGVSVCAPATATASAPMTITAKMPPAMIAFFI